MMGLLFAFCGASYLHRRVRCRVIRHDSSCRKSWTSRIVPIAVRLGISGYLISTADGKPISVFGGLTSPRPLPTLAHRQTLPVPAFLARVERRSIVRYARIYGLKHHFIDKDDTLKRMLGKSSLTMEYKK